MNGPGKEAKHKNQIDEIASALGIGKFQVLNLFFFCLVGVFTTISSQTFVFASRDTPYRCLIPECDTTSSSYSESWLEQAIPFYNGVPSKCEKFEAYNVTSELIISDKLNNSDLCFPSAFNNQTVLGCTDWIYDEEHITIVKDFNIPCDDFKRSLVGSISMAGQLTSLLFTGLLSDKYGRRFMMIILSSAMGLFGFIQSFSLNLWIYLTFEFFTASASAGAYSSGYTFCVEILSSKTRIYGIVVLILTCVLGYIALGFLAWNIQSWRILVALSNAPALLIALAYFFIPESFRWLNAKGKTQKCAEILRKAAIMNRIHISESRYKEIDSLVTKPAYNLSVNSKMQKKASLREVFTSAKLSIRLFLCSYGWFSIVCDFYGLAVNSVNISGKEKDVYLNYITIMSMDLLSVFVALLSLRFMERKYSIFISLLICGTSMITYAAFPYFSGTVKLLLYIVGKIFIRISFMNIYLYTTEIFPTEIRNSTMCFCSVFGRIGGMIAPQILLLNKIHPSLPMLTFGIIPIISAVTMFKLPKTKDKVLPDTIEEAENLE